MSLAVEIGQRDLIFSVESQIKTYSLSPAPLAASIVYYGNLWKIPDIVSNLYRWLGINGYTSAGAYREIHLFGRELDLFATDPPGEGVIEIMVPVEKL
jgi:hypothetical protein